MNWVRHDLGTAFETGLKHIHAIPDRVKFISLSRYETDGCGHGAPKSVARFTPDQGLMGSGAANLNLPTGGSAYGIPRYLCTDLPYGRFSILPTTAPDSVRTTGERFLSISTCVEFSTKKKAQVKIIHRTRNETLMSKDRRGGRRWDRFAVSFDGKFNSTYTYVTKQSKWCEFLILRRINTRTGLDSHTKDWRIEHLISTVLICTQDLSGPKGVPTFS